MAKRNTVEDYRLLFLDAVCQKRGHVLDDLAREPWTLYRSLLDEWSVLNVGKYLLQYPEDWPPYLPDPPADKYDALAAAVEAWGERWQLADYWCLHAAYAALWRWWLQGQPYRGWAGLTIGPQPYEPPPPTYNINLPSYLPFRGDVRDEYRARMLERVAALIDQHMDSVDALCREWGILDDAKGKRDPKLHMEWLARYQVPKEDGRTYEGYNTIGKSASVGDKAVESAVEDTAMLIGLSKRKGKRGRPRKIPVSS